MSIAHNSELCAMPNDILYTIIGFVKDDIKSLIYLKITSIAMNREITRFKIAKCMLSTKFDNYDELYLCVNSDCYEETYDIFTYLHNYGYRRYIHKWQEALNRTTIVVNKKKYNVNSPYCCECFKKHILVGSRENVDQLFDNDIQVNIVYK
jgi:hypothetical protein